MWSPEARAGALAARKAKQRARGDRRYVKQAVKDAARLDTEATNAAKRAKAKQALLKGKKQNVAAHAARAARYQK